MAEETEPSSGLSAVPLFPLPNVVLFPRAVLPLHIFEERYKAMTAHALAGDRLVAMALLKPGWEKNYYSRPAIEPVVCVGKILSHERLPDGCYNFLLQGQARCRIVRETGGHSFRTAELQPLRQAPALEIDLDEHRRRLVSLFEHSALRSTAIAAQFRQFLASPLSTADVADLVAFYFLEDVALKQALLSETDVVRRVSRLLEEFEAACPPFVPVAGGVEDPSLN